MTNALDHQVGGNHYSKYKIQPVECIQHLGLDFLRGNILKYLVRFQDKNGIEDIKKARHYAEMLLEKMKSDAEYFHMFLDQLEGNPLRDEMCLIMPGGDRVQWLINSLNGIIERMEIEQK